MKFKVLPSTRIKKRYVAFKLISSGPVQLANIKDSIRASIIKWIGEKGFGESGYKFISWDEKQKIGIIRCNHTFVDDIKVALALVHQIGDEHVIFASFRVSGTIKGLGKERPKVVEE
ncbi:MAG: Rpp14/Pop5 family protein [Candidatus Aenigmatarchaeota archaeon]